jgi:hypothetical protein
MANKLDLADAQLLGFSMGKNNCDGIIDLIESMGLTKSEWNKWKKKYPNCLHINDFESIEEHFNKKSKKEIISQNFRGRIMDIGCR